MKYGGCQTAVFQTAILSLALLVSAESRAEVKVASEVNRGRLATAAFRFERFPSPSRTDAASAARFTIVGGDRDSKGGSANCLNDGTVPSDEDEPGANFFFAPGSDGGRLLVDLGEAIDVRQINSYSWHPNARGPQVYKLYADNPHGQKTAPPSGKSPDLVQAGWTLLARVDTRPKQQPAGGQHGVSIADAAGGSIGRHRYLLFDVSRTEGEDAFGNTFFSEIDVSDGKVHPAARPPEAKVLDVLKIADKYEIVFDTSQLPEIKEWVDTKLKPVCATWYPKIVELLPSEDYSAPTRFTIVFHKNMDGVANTSGTRVNCAGPWFLRNLNGEAAGAVVHELVHVVQQYGGRRGNRNPGWLVEGVADYLRWFLYEPKDLRPRPNPSRAKYTDSYRTTAAFLDYLMRTHDEKIVEKFNAAMRRGEYSDDLWKKHTGHTVEELWTDYVKTLEERAT